MTYSYLGHKEKSILFRSASAAAGLGSTDDDLHLFMYKNDGIMNHQNTKTATKSEGVEPHTIAIFDNRSSISIYGRYTTYCATNITLGYSSHGYFMIV